MLETKNIAAIDEQKTFALRVNALLKKIYNKTPNACIVTYGCQQNVSDSERIRGMLCQMGYNIVEETKEADFIIFNTCAVREHAEDRVWGNIGATKRLKRNNPNMLICVCGCMAQQDIVRDRVKQSYPYVDILFGTHVLYRLPEFVYKRLSGSPRIFETSTDNTDIVEDIPVERDRGIKGWLPVMYGCNNFCTYCIVPYVRGRERSRAPEEILKEARQMVKDGYKDITLLGQNVNSYGKDAAHGVNFAKLLRMINDIPGDFRIRFMTSHPKDCTEELLLAMSECEKVAHHLHLPFQCGSDRILDRMNRRYTRDTYLALVNRAKELMPDISLTSDIIVGFPGETYEDFKQTVSLIKEVEFSSLFTFIFSARHGTPAAQFEDPISREEKGIWFNELLIAQEEISNRLNAKHVGKTYRVLCDDYGRNDGFLAGHTDTNAVIEFKAPENRLGNFVNVRVDRLTNVLEGTLID